MLTETYTWKKTHSKLCGVNVEVFIPMLYIHVQLYLFHTKYTGKYVFLWRKELFCSVLILHFILLK